ncbi:MAG: hypothetical protein J7L41_02755 [Synergistetes bacterium]|nr:hypothetical protein [Synergistota bacterium]
MQFPSEGVFLLSAEFVACGPLKNKKVDFYPFCVVYAPNEVGKTYMVEGIARTVFGKSAGIKSREGCSYVGVELLVDGENKRLDIDSGGIALDEEVARLSVIRAGDSSVELGQLEAILYGNSLNRLISAVKSLKSREPKDELTRYIEEERLLSQIENGLFLSGESARRLFEIEEEITFLEREFERYKGSLSHLFFRMQRRYGEVEKELSRLRDADIEGVVSLVKEYEFLLGRLSELESEKHSVEKEYCRLKIAGAGKRSAAVVGYFGFCVSVVGAVIIFMSYYGVLGGFVPWQPVGGVLSVVGAAISAFFTRRSRSCRTQVREYERKYGEKFISVEGDSSADELYIRLRSIDKEIKGSMLKLEQVKRSVEVWLEGLGITDFTPDRWGKIVLELKELEARLLEDKQKLQMRLSDIQDMGVEPLDFVDDTMWHEQWNYELMEAYGEITGKLREIRKRLMELKEEKRRVEDGVRELKVRLEGMIGNPIGEDMLSVRKAFYDFYGGVRSKIKELEAHCFVRERGMELLERYRADAVNRIKSALHEIALPMVQRLSDYSGLDVRRKKGRAKGVELLLSKEGANYSIEELSTGMSEQLYLAVRLGVVENKSRKRGFFLLDDAFQHTDWDRRRILVEELKEFCNRKWQVIYFTMDYHIRALFKRQGAVVIDL